MKSISKINPAITEKMEHSIIKEYAPTIDQKNSHKVGVCLNHNVWLQFVSATSNVHTSV